MSDALTIANAQPGDPTSRLDVTVPRRRLAPNVVCMFAEDQPRIVQHRRGRFPRIVTKLWAWQRLNEGDIAVFIKGKNTGKRVCVGKDDDTASWSEGEGRLFDVESLDGLLWLGGKDGEPLTQSVVALCGASWLRKLSSGRRP